MSGQGRKYLNNYNSHSLQSLAENLCREFEVQLPSSEEIGMSEIKTSEQPKELQFKKENSGIDLDFKASFK